MQSKWKKINLKYHVQVILEKYTINNKYFIRNKEYKHQLLIINIIYPFLINGFVEVKNNILSSILNLESYNRPSPMRLNLDKEMILDVIMVIEMDS